MKKYYALTVNGTIAEIYIFGDIVSWEWIESDVSSYTLSKELQGLDVEQINVHINSYGGEVKEGLAIYNMLKNHTAKIVTICDGFACSAASVVFMAGDERVMNSASLLMIHNAWTVAVGNAEEMRKTADELEKISDAAANTYRDARLSISDEELEEMLKAETWISAAEALDWGFTTSIIKTAESGKAAASARASLCRIVIAGRTAHASRQEPSSNPEPPMPPQPPAENKTMKIIKALAGAEKR